jgi:hypothetical protein
MNPSFISNSSLLFPTKNSPPGGGLKEAHPIFGGSMLLNCIGEENAPRSEFMVTDVSEVRGEVEEPGFPKKEKRFLWTIDFCVLDPLLLMASFGVDDTVVDVGIVFSPQTVRFVFSYYRDLLLPKSQISISQKSFISKILARKKRLRGFELERVSTPGFSVEVINIVSIGGSLHFPM